MSFKRTIPWISQPQYPAPLKGDYKQNLLGYFPNNGIALPTYDLTFAGNAAYGVAPFGKATLFDGTGDYTSAGDAFHSDEYTILVTFNAKVLSADSKGIILKRNIGVSSNIDEIWLYATSSVIGFIAWDAAAAQILNFSASLAPVAGKTYTIGIDIPPGSGTAYMYVNGVQVANAGKTGIIGNTNSQLQFGTRSFNTDARYWNGYIGQAVFWSKRRNDTRELTANPWQIYEPLKRNIYVEASGGGLSANLGLSTETDSAQAITAAKSITLGLVTETGTAQPITASKSATLGLNTEADTAQSITTAKALGLGLNTENDTAQPLTFGLSASLGLATETDTAPALTTAKTLASGLATETDTPLALSASKSLSLGMATETDSAQAITAAKSLTLGLASETDNAIALGAGLSANLGLVSESDQAQPITASKSITLGIVTEAEFAQAVTYYKSIGVLQAAETDSVFALAVQKTLTLGLASETDSALALVFDTGTGDPPDAIFTVPSERRIFMVASERRIFNS